MRTLFWEKKTNKIINNNTNNNTREIKKKTQRQGDRETARSSSPADPIMPSTHTAVSWMFSLAAISERLLLWAQQWHACQNCAARACADAGAMLLRPGRDASAPSPPHPHPSIRLSSHPNADPKWKKDRDSVSPFYIIGAVNRRDQRRSRRAEHRRARLHRSRGAGELPPPQVEELDQKRLPSGYNERRSGQKACSARSRQAKSAMLATGDLARKRALGAP